MKIKETMLDIYKERDLEYQESRKVKEDNTCPFKRTRKACNYGICDECWKL